MENTTKSYTFYEPNGKITSNLTASLEVFGLVVASNEFSYIEGEYSPAFYYIKDGLPVEKPPRPDSTYDFNYNSYSWEPNLAAAELKIKNIRNQLLQESDWTDTVSAQTRLGETLYNSWQTYRQDLRDITLQAGYPFEVVFPTAPE
jgi:hypothetical protein